MQKPGRGSIPVHSSRLAVAMYSVLPSAEERGNDSAPGRALEACGSGRAISYAWRVDDAA